MKLLTMFFVLATIVSAQAQTLKGKLIDQQTNQTIPYANVILKGKYIGSSSNDKGIFRFPLNNENRKDSLLVSCIGYEPKTLPINQLSLLLVNTIYLKPSSTELDMVLVKSKMPTVEEIIRKTSNKFKKQFRKAPYLGEFYYAESKYVDNEFASGLEGVGDIYFHKFKSSLHNNRQYWGQNLLLFDELRSNKTHNWNFDKSWDISDMDESEIKLLKKHNDLEEYYTRSLNENYLLSSLSIGYGWSIIANGPLFVTSDFTYKLEDIIDRNNEALYVLSFTTKDSIQVKGSGKIYIRENYEVTSITSKDFNIPFEKNYGYTLKPYIKNRKKSEGKIQFTYLNGQAYLQNINYTVDYNNPDTPITYEGVINVTNFSTVECYNLRSATMFRFGDANMLSMDGARPFAKYNGAFWEFRPISVTKHSKQINLKEIRTKSLYDIHEKERVAYDKRYNSRFPTDSLKVKAKTKRYLDYRTSRDLLKRSAYGDLVIADDRSNKKVIKEEFNNMTNPKQYHADLFNQKQSIMDSLNYQLAFMKQVEEGSYIINNTSNTYESSFELFKRVIKNMGDTLLAYRPKLSERYVKESKGNILALWFEANTIYAETFTESIRANNSNHLLSALYMFDLNDTSMYSSPVLAQYIAELIDTHINLIENQYTPIEKPLRFSSSLSDIQHFQKINTQYIANKQLQEEVLFQYMKEQYHNDTLQNTTYNHYIKQFKQEYPQSKYQKELTLLTKRRKGFEYYRLSKQYELLDTELNEVKKSFSKGIYVIDIWASWCGSCIRSIKNTYPSLIEKYASKDVQFVFMSFDQGVKRWRDTLKKYPLQNAEQYKVSDEEQRAMKEALNVRGFPLQLIVKDGIVIKRITGANHYLLEKEIEALVKLN